MHFCISEEGGVTFPRARPYKGTTFANTNGKSGFEHPSRTLFWSYALPCWPQKKKMTDSVRHFRFVQVLLCAGNEVTLVTEAP
jgi:hypothetical protein